MTAATRRGGVIAAAYVAVAVATSLLSSSPTRPLFDGFAPPVPYNWVKPPPELAGANRPPQPAEQTVRLLENGSEAANASTADAQVIVTMPAGAFAPSPPETAVIVGIVPLDAGTLAPPPPDRRVVSNAYRVEFRYDPSGAGATPVSPQATIALTAATQGDTLLYSPAGQEWQEVTSRRFGGTHGVIGPLSGPGYYLVAASPRVTAPITTTPGSGAAEGGGSGGALVVVGVVAVGGIAAAAGVTVRKRQAEKRRQAEELRRRQRAGQTRRRKPPRKRRS